MSLESFYNSPPKSLVTNPKIYKIPIKKELELNKFGLLNIVENNVLLVKMIKIEIKGRRNIFLFVK